MLFYAAIASPHPLDVIAIVRELWVYFMESVEALDLMVDCQRRNALTSCVTVAILIGVHSFRENFRSLFRVHQITHLSVIDKSLHCVGVDLYHRKVLLIVCYFFIRVVSDDFNKINASVIFI